MGLQNKIKIFPSVLSADFAILKEEVKRVSEAPIDGFHLDIMDGQFVPNLSMGSQVVAAVNRSTSLFLDVHLMIYNPFQYIEQFVQAGADRITFHIEATEDVEETIEFIKKCNVLAGLAISPETSPSLLLRYLDLCDSILVMTVNPGFGGQALIPETLDKVRFLHETIAKLKITREDAQGKFHPLPIQVDGGVHDGTIRQCLDAGATEIVSGSFLFKHSNIHEAVASLRI